MDEYSVFLPPSLISLVLFWNYCMFGAHIYIYIDSYRWIDIVCAHNKKKNAKYSQTGNGKRNTKRKIVIRPYKQQQQQTETSYILGPTIKRRSRSQTGPQ